MKRVSSGLADLDDLFGGLIPGDNIVWVGDDQELLVTSVADPRACSGTLLSIKFKNRRNSSARCRRVMAEITCPDATFKAA